MSKFFEEMTEGSEVKCNIVTKFFNAWSNVMKNQVERMIYIDLYSGPGRYKDGSPSTPLRILERILSEEVLTKKTVTIFNDADSNNTKTLEEEIYKLPEINSLDFEPVIINSEVGVKLADYFESTSLYPTFAFVDPFGYKGLSSRLIEGLTKDWGSDCIFFFNYNRVNAALTNPKVDKHITAIFGEKRLEKLREKVEDLNPIEREEVVLNALAKTLSNKNKNYVLPFRFLDKNGTRTSHYLIFVSKHVLGYTIMKDIMWKESTSHQEGVATFTYIPVHSQLSMLSSYAMTLDDLEDDLLKKFSRKTLYMGDIFNSHHVGTPFVKPNYKEVLKRLEESGKIKANPPAKKRKKNTFGDKVLVTFP